MKLVLEPGMRERLLAEKRRALPDATLNQWFMPAFGFPHPQTKVTPISVDTAGRVVPSPGQKGFCVQWR
jgi:hypothetical protein